MKGKANRMLEFSIDALPVEIAERRQILRREKSRRS